MKTAKEIIKEMEKEFDKKFIVFPEEDIVDGFSAKELRVFLRQFARTLLEAFGEEVIGEDTYHTITDPDRIDAGKKAPHPYNDHRAEQRLKVKEIINSITK